MRVSAMRADRKDAAADVRDRSIMENASGTVAPNVMQAIVKAANVSMNVYPPAMLADW
jgi:hypothetical protein